MTVVLDRGPSVSGGPVPGANGPNGPKGAYKHYVLGVLTLVCIAQLPRSHFDHFICCSRSKRIFIYRIRN